MNGLNKIQVILRYEIIDMKRKIFIIGGARPNFVKIAPLIRAITEKNNFLEYKLIHTGQHYEYRMSQVFLKELGIPDTSKYYTNLGIRSDLYPFTTQIALIKRELQDIFEKERPDLCLVVGDCNSAVGGALAASVMKIPLGHVEAGLRSFDRRMPEEINRLIIDTLSDYLFTTESGAVKNLKKEGIRKEKIFLTGNVMIDTLLKHKNQASKIAMPKKLNLKNKNYAVLTLHRPENVDRKDIFEEILKAIDEIQKKIKVVWLVHPRAQKQLEKFNFLEWVKRMDNLKLNAPLGYLEMLSLVNQSKFVLTDSGGLQEETTVLKIPCLTLRDNTERPITVRVGTNRVVGVGKNNIIRESLKIIKGAGKKGRIPFLWDGEASERIIKVISNIWTNQN